MGKKTVEKVEKELSTIKKASGDSVNQVKEQKTVLEKENKDATLKIIRLQDEKAKLQAKLNDDVQDLNRTMKTVREELNKTLKVKSDLEDSNRKLAEERDKDIEKAIMAKDVELLALDNEKKELIKEAEVKEKKLLFDLLNAKAEGTESSNKIDDELRKVKGELASKIEELEKLNKAKKEVAAAKDKALKKANSIESETSTLKESIAKLEAEKLANNFGKSDREKMKADLDKSTEAVG